MSKHDSWGFHLLIDVAGCNKESITNRENIYNFIKQLVVDIDMVAYGQPTVVHFGSADKAGYTLVQLIETSNICCHFVEENNSMYLDVFSCKPFEAADVETIVKLYFSPQKINKIFLNRQA
jgi:S-adenosylmethionine/arginine decarboxylase-like enzyme